MSLLLERLADEVGVHERTLRRAVGSGLIRARRATPRELSLGEVEIEWVRSHWPLIVRLRAALRTEPNVVLAVLFGSMARGDDVPGSSDVDLMVELHNAHPGALLALHRRLSDRLGVEIQLVPLQAAQRDASLMSEVLRDGRPMVDRTDAWPRLQAHREQTRKRAGSAERALRREAHAALDYFQKLAASAPSANR